AGNWTYTANSAFDSLSVGQSVSDTFTVASADGTTTSVQVSINGTNDAPIVSTPAVAGEVTELLTPVGDLTDSYTITFTDVDITDVHTLSVTPLGTPLGALTAVKDSDTTGTGTGGTLTVTYTVAASAVEFLAAGQTRVESFTVTLDDQNGGVVSKQVDLTITGTNDAPILSAADVSGAVTELTGAPAGNLSDTGVISFTDVDLSDAHLVSASGTPVGTTLGTLTAVMNSDTTGTGTGGLLTWTYTVAASAVEFLAAGETRVESFTITLDDQNGGAITRQIDVTVTGTNDAALISGTATGAVVEAGGLDNTTPGTPGVTGTLTVSDADAGQAVFQSPANLAGTYGDFSFDATTGAWTYTLDGVKSDALTQGQVEHDTLTVTSADGTATQIIDVTVTGANDVASIFVAAPQGAISTFGATTQAAASSGTVSGAVVEAGGVANATAGTPSVSGTLSVSDVDTGEAVFRNPASLVGSYGDFSFDALSGAWSYTLDAGRSDALAQDQVVNDTLTVTSADGTATQTIDVTVTGTNDAAIVSSAVVALDETDAALTTSGTLSISDVDSPATFVAQAATVGTNGTFSIDAAGVWSYTANSAFDALNVGDSVSDTYTVAAADGTTTSVQVTINGTNDAAILSSATVALDETDAPLTTGGTLSISDVDSPATFVAQAATVGTNGSFSIDAAGVWSYTANSAFDTLNAGDSVSDQFTVTGADGTATTVQVSVNGTNDAAILSSAVVALDETDVGLTTSGTLTISDVDSPQTFVAQSATAGANGTFSIDAAGAWTYTANSAFDSLNVGDSVSDQFTVTSADGTATTVQVSITGTNDAPVATPVTLTAIAEDSGARLITAAELLAGVSDVDGPVPTITSLTIGTGNGTLADNGDGTWSYTPALNDDTAVTFNYTASDGSLSASSTASLDITPVNDAPVISSLAQAGSATEDGILSAGGQVTATDVDHDAVLAYSGSVA
ncbi:MAG: tandem-95 repeat protein, partial [Burkholderiaceae bacterium]|nr:tandem-95 repeat protein [Burkholderiaceae bacterium]